MRDWVTLLMLKLRLTKGVQSTGKHSETIHKDVVNKIAIIETTIFLN